ncbi:Stk1 family PASTA domain-containing Ser/Thr kinase [Bacillus gobiensis]|uniref:Stk1 family PASTA domain-containing Ser/Thr kinase n=1 Tax=Bacillus gobiensis TaxID=1441095 RepID=UPI003D1B18F2
MLIGKRISGRYQVLRVIGGGGMANVYLAEDMILDREVAIKVLRFDFVNDNDFIRRFRREAQSATSLDHPNIVSIYDVGEEGDIYYIVMEYVEGMTLKEYIKVNGPLHPQEAAQIMEQIVSAMEHAHQNHIVHRDIKPHNILINHFGEVKVTDFGIAMALSSSTITHTNAVLGSVHYLSPEQARGGLATKKSDIYALGIVLFELVTGRMPFEGESAVSIALKHLQSDTPSAKRWNPLVPQSLENIILKAMAKDPFHRYNSAEEMEQDLRSAFDPERLNENRFTIPADDEMTKAIPVIKDSHVHSEETLVHGQKNQAQHSTEGEGANQKEDQKKPKKKKKKWPIVLLTIFLMLIASGVLAVFVYPSIFFPPDVEVPDVSGLEVDEANNILKDKGLVVAGDSFKIKDETIEAGKIVRTNPQTGTVVKEGSQIQLYESTGKETVQLDNLIGENIDRAKETLTRKGFQRIRTEEVNDDSEVGTIIDQAPSADSNVVPEDDEIVLTVSKGPEEIELRDLQTYSKQAAAAYLDDNGLKMAEKEAHSEDIAEGQVIEQKPAAGESVKLGDEIELTFSLGPEEKPIKTVTEEVDIPYEPTTPGEELSVQISIDDAEHSISDPYETFTITEPAKRSIEFKIAPDQKGYYQVTINNRLVSSKTIEYPE